MPQESNKRRIAVSLHSLVFVFLALVIALSSQFASRAWFSNNDKVQAEGLSISAERAGLIEEIHYFRATETRLLSSVAGEKYNEYRFSYAASALDFSLPSGNGTPERSSFSDAISLPEHSDLSANSQVLVRIKVHAPGQYKLSLNTKTADYFGNVLAARTENGPFDLSPTALPLSSVVHFAILPSAAVLDDTTGKVLSLTETSINAADMRFVEFADGQASFRSPFASLTDEKLTVTVGEDCYLYIFMDYYLPAVEDVVEKTLLYVDHALLDDPSYNDIIVGYTNLIFAVDFALTLEEVSA